MSWDVFIAHAGADTESARTLYELLSPTYRVFLDAESLSPGDDWDTVIPEAQRTARMSVLMISQASSDAYYLREEIAAAIQLSRMSPADHRVVPVFLDGVDFGSPRLPYGIRILHGLDAAREGLPKVAEMIARRFSESDAEADVPTARRGRRPLETRERLDLHRRLADLPAPDFERLVASLSFRTPVLDLERPQSTRAIDLLHRIQTRTEVNELLAGLDAAERSLQSAWRQALVHRVSRFAPRVGRLLVAARVLEPSPHRRAVHDYLVSFDDEMAKLNQSGPHVAEVVPARAGSLDARPSAEGEYGPPVVGLPLHRRVRQVLRMLSGLSKGGSHATARVASLSRSRLVRNVERLLLRARYPLILLGDPGSGKSMTLREVGRRLARKGTHSPWPRVPVYVRLGKWRAGEGLRATSILELIESSIPEAHRSLRDMLPVLVAERRLVVLFDGMDEMERSQYVQRVAQLSRFARVYRRRVQTLFACRINDFSPEFEHRQLVLLPFDRRQVREYVRANALHPIRVEGSVYRDRRFVAELHRRPVVRELVSNPLTLFLLCHFVSETERWPESRTVLVELFLQTLVHRLSQHPETVRLSAEAHRETVSRWAAIAYAISIQRGGTEISRDILSREVSGVDSALVLGTRAGLFLVDPDTGNFRFTHHRLQEYLTARHLAQASPVLDWQHLLDSPRWQETLVSLAAIDADSDGIRALAELLARSKLVPPASEEILEDSEDPTSHSAEGASVEEETLESAGGTTEKDPSDGAESPQAESSPWGAEAERLWADRALLASEVLREARRADPSAAGSLGESLADAIRDLSAQGRPTSQVKMLWAWSSVAGLVPFSVLRRQLDSSVRWVRDQAILLVGGLSAIGRAEDRNLGIELAVDLSAGQVFRRVPTYVRSANQTAGFGWIPMLLWACLCQLLLFGVASVAVVDFLLRMVHRFPVAALEPPADAWVALVGLVIATFLVRRLFEDAHIARVAAYVSGLMAALQVFASTLQFEGAFSEALFDAVVRSVPPFVLLLLVLFVFHWLALVLFLAPFAVSPSGQTFRVGLRAAARHESWFYDLAAGLLALIPLGFSGAFLALDWFLDSRLGALLGIGCFVLWLFAAITMAVLAVRDAIRDRDPRGPLKGIAFIVVGLVGMAAVVLGYEAATKAGAHQQILLWVVALLGLALLARVLFVILRIVHLRLRGRHLNLEQWCQRMRRSGPFGQLIYLRAVSRHDLGVEPRVFLEALEELEPAIQQEPALSPYWKLRQDLEQIVRLDTSPQESEAVSEERAGQAS